VLLSHVEAIVVVRDAINPRRGSRRLHSVPSFAQTSSRQQRDQQ